MLVWAAFEARLLAAPAVEAPRRSTRLFLAQPAVKAAIGRRHRGSFTLGRPLAVFREFLLYAAQPAERRLRRRASWRCSRSRRWRSVRAAGVHGRARPRVRHECDGRIASRARQRSSRRCAIAAGGAFLIFYWAITRVWPWLGRWGFQLGLYQ